MRALITLLALVIVLPACGNDGPRPANDVDSPDREAHTIIDAPDESPSAAEVVDGVQQIEVRITENGFVPASLGFKSGVPAVIGITRENQASCGEMVQIPGYDVMTPPLPVGQRVALEFKPFETGVFQIVCGIDSERGRIVVG